LFAANTRIAASTQILPSTKRSLSDRQFPSTSHHQMATVRPLNLFWTALSHAGRLGPTVQVKNVLVLYSQEREMAAYAPFDKALRSQLESAADHPLTVYTEYLDLMRFPDENQQQKLVDYLRVKYSSRKIDLLFAVSPLALKFLVKNGGALFPGTPLVFASVNIRVLETLSLKPNITGIAVKRDIRDTLDIALRLQPDTTQVIVPVGTSPLERLWTADLRNSLRPYEDHLTITYLSDLPMDGILDRLRNLPQHTIVLFSQLFFHDRDGRYFPLEKALDLICRWSNSPVYGTDETFLGSGIVGGHLYDLTKVGDEAGKMGRPFLAGETLANTPIQTLDPNFDMFDARQLKRWGISQAKLPTGSIVHFTHRRLGRFISGMFWLALLYSCCSR
jgi:hypothetical protein